MEAHALWFFRERGKTTRLNADGTLDHTFNPGSGAGLPTAESPRVNGIAVQPDGKVLIAGWFATFNGTLRNCIARLNVDGSLDTSFTPGTGADGEVRAIALQPDGNVLIGGDFTTVNGVPRLGLARLYGDGVPFLTITRSGDTMIVSWPAPATGFVLQDSADLNPATWTTPSETLADNGTTKSITVNLAPGSRFFRLLKP